jgi:hypothetical protein
MFQNCRRRFPAAAEGRPFKREPLVSVAVQSACVNNRWAAPTKPRGQNSSAAFGPMMGANHGRSYLSRAYAQSHKVTLDFIPSEDLSPGLRRTCTLLFRLRGLASSRSSAKK